MPPTPNTFVIGAMKSGTSSLCRYMSEHPQVFVCEPKEPMHFSRRSLYSRGNDRYLSLFARAKCETILVDGSTEYAKRPGSHGVVERIHEFNPSARIVYIMRDPLERAISHYKHVVKIGREHRRLSEALRSKNNFLIHSDYAYQLQPYLEVFGRERIYLEAFENLVSDPVRTCANLFRWLGVDSNFVPPSAGQVINRSPSVSHAINDASALGWILRRAPALKSLARIAPPAVVRAVNSRVRRGVPLSGREYEADLREARRMLAPLCAAFATKLHESTGITFDAWESARREPCFELPSGLWLPPELSERLQSLSESSGPKSSPGSAVPT